MITRWVFYFILAVITIGLGYSFIIENIFYSTYTIFYPKTKDTLNQPQSHSYCQEQVKINNYRFEKKQRIFTVLENLMTGPRNIFLEPFADIPISVKKVYGYEDLLIIDFNPYIFYLNTTEETILIQTLMATVNYNFPEYQQIKLLVDGRNFDYIKGSYRYSEPLNLNSHKTSYLNNINHIKFSSESSCKNVS